VQLVAEDAAIAQAAINNLGMNATEVEQAVSSLKQWMAPITLGDPRWNEAHRHDTAAYQMIPLTLQMQDTTISYGSAIALKVGAGCRQSAKAIAELLTLSASAANPSIQQSGNQACFPISPALNGLQLKDVSIANLSTGWLSLRVSDRALAIWLEQLSYGCPLQDETLPPLRTDWCDRDRALIWEMHRIFARCVTLRRLAQTQLAQDGQASPSILPLAQWHSNSPNPTKPGSILPENWLKLSRWLTPSGQIELSEPTEWALLETLIRLVDQFAALGWDETKLVTNQQDRLVVRSLAQDLCDRVQAFDAACRILSPAIAPHSRWRWVQWLAIAQMIVSWLLVVGWQIHPIRTL
jgi:hypothetical protein